MKKIDQCFETFDAVRGEFKSARLRSIRSFEEE
jgi:hypothetical protein